ncbi:TetR/AcrR family transcriptional regulator [Promicromonospora vindobonensis]|uniref:TetR/AcrR family transcriptional regulator n=1 Tax=Promicromonospora vindobonensis TaxID=195748 RepID=A0ABW5VTZ0_9MICO
MVVRLSRAAQQQLTHERLLEAGRAVYLRRGFLAATVEEIAEEAGYTRGAVYKHFGGKEGLWQAITDATADAHLTRLCAALNEAATRGQLVAALLPDVRSDDGTRWSLAAVEYIAAINGRPADAERAMAAQRRNDELVTAALAGCCTRLGIRPVMPLPDLVTVLASLGGSLTLRSAMDPDTDVAAIVSGFIEAMFPAPEESGR